MFSYGCSPPPRSAGDVARIETKDIFANSQARKLSLAAEAGDIAMIDLLIAQGVNVNHKGAYGVTPLFRCVLAGNKRGFAHLLAHGADPNIRHVKGLAVMHEASLLADPFFLELALKNKGDPNLLDIGNPFTIEKTPIFYAISERRAANAKLLIESGADVNHVDKREGQFPLYVAYRRPSFEIVFMLLKAGANPLQRRNGEGENFIEWMANWTTDDIDEDDEKTWFLKVRTLLKK